MGGRRIGMAQKEKERAVGRGKGRAKLSESRGFIDSSINENLEDLEDNNEVPDTGIDDEEYQVSIDEEKPLFARMSARPLWLLYNNQLLWAVSDFGFHIQQREYFRQLIQKLLDFLVKEFPNKSSEELLLSLCGFFVKNGDKKSDKNSEENSSEEPEITIYETEESKAKEEVNESVLDNQEKKSGNWLNSFGSAGIVYGKNKILLIRSLRASKGQGKAVQSVNLPEGIEHLWLERELAKPENQLGNKNPLGWAHFYKQGADGTMFTNLLAFCKKINSAFDDEDNEKLNILGLRKIEFNYTEDIHKGGTPTKLTMWQSWRKTTQENKKEEN